MVAAGENLYLNNMPPMASIRYPGEAQPGDVIIRQPFPGADPCHSMILLHDNLVLHHDHAGHLSRENKCARHTLSRCIPYGDTNSAHL
jgi:cell wall-associated NlpC family hydrolase